MTFKDLLAHLQKDYLETLSQKIETISALAQSRDLEAVQTEFHKLKGTGGTYGLPEITKLGETLEALCIRDHHVLPTAIPISLSLLASIREKRLMGQTVNLDEDHEFQKLARLLPPSSKV